mmetsp:Transcript_30621/g.42665  ORF Transcript_30621/g.42665 Transcript_30621/m.42665 type:complete len:335 (-) Transcript_30621:59-1063(-)|eukprot:CAMPEP_0175103828 /NCGR_PEP_ID=MMETSP0086_2-20121207/9340_1 /TAXON_ID=136419 /ORGANISM="Unknown Unknown, Strain D1" /LENGTH=334 /DNA_ID=CAMNT_0016379055 /DNA_START=64 /DNA_END=1068 /DNA_ORIENTATION=+
MEWAKPLAVVGMIGFIYFVFLYNNLVPQVQRLYFTGDTGMFIDPYVPAVSFSQVLSISIAFHVCFAMLTITFTRAVLTPAGSIPRTRKWKYNGKDSEPDSPALRRLKDILSFPIRVKESQESLRAFMKTVPVAERKKTLERRVCDKCNAFKPDRCHHCRYCNTCVLRMDHHCPFISNCVGANNHKFFFQMLFYGLMCAVFVLVDMFHRFLHVFRPMLDWQYFFKMDLPVGFAYVLTLVVFVALFCFFSFHVYLVLNCLTTIEHMEKKQSSDPDAKHRWKMVHLKFSHGYYGNLCHVLGEPWMWLLPIKPRHRTVTDGTYSATHVKRLDPESLDI